MRPLILLFAAVALAACSTTQQRVLVPIAAPCVPSSLAPAPSYPDTDHALRTAHDSAERYRLIILGREARIARLGLLEPVVEACQETAE